MHVLGDAGLGVKPANPGGTAIAAQQVSIGIALRVFTVQGAAIAAPAGPMNAMNCPLTCAFELRQLHALGVLLALCQSVVAR
jgi:hypothetical protein